MNIHNINLFLSLLSRLTLILMDFDKTVPTIIFFLSLIFNIDYICFLVNNEIYLQSFLIGLKM